MKNKLVSLFAALALAGTATVANAQKSDTFQTPSGKSVTITHIKHASVQITFEGKHIYVDPESKLAPQIDFTAYPNADIILITHEHPDHFDQLAINHLQKSNTAYYMNANCHFYMQRGTIVQNGDSMRIADNIKLWAVPAYNTTPGREKFHPKGRDNGFVVTVDGLRIYVAGDTEDIPEMEQLAGMIDIAFLPCNQPYTMTVDQLVRAAKVIKPKVLFPYHLGNTSVNQIKMKLMGSGIDVRLRDYK